MHFSCSYLLLFLTAVSLDSMTAGFSYGAKRVRISPPALLFLSCIPAVFITAASILGTAAGTLLPAKLLSFLSFFLLTALGSAKLLESLIRHLAKKHPSLTGNWGCRIKQVNIIFTIYLSPEEANQTDLQILSAKEALLLSLALSLDSVLAGMAFYTAAIPWPLLLISAAFFNLLLFLSGCLLGRLLSHALHMDLSWLSGLCLLLLACRSLA